MKVDYNNHTHNNEHEDYVLRTLKLLNSIGQNHVTTALPSAS